MDARALWRLNAENRLNCIQPICWHGAVPVSRKKNKNFFFVEYETRSIDTRATTSVHEAADVQSKRLLIYTTLWDEIQGVKDLHFNTIHKQFENKLHKKLHSYLKNCKKMSFYYSIIFEKFNYEWKLDTPLRITNYTPRFIWCSNRSLYSMFPLQRVRKQERTAVFLTFKRIRTQWNLKHKTPWNAQTSH